MNNTYETLFDLITENAPEYKFYDLYALDSSCYVWLGNVANVFEFYELELVDWVDEEAKAIYLVKSIEEL